MLARILRPTALHHRPLTRSLHASLPRREKTWAGLTNILAGEIPPPVQVKSMTAAGIELQDGTILPGASIFLEGKIFLWDVPATLWQGWDKDRFEVFEVVVPRPEILLLGTGRSVVPPPAPLRQYLNQLGIQVDVMDTWNACTTYNLLAEEGRRVAAALLPYNSLQHWKA
ncbi:DUF498-domain-containing protein [Auriscalpium vulgare]|uniref:DUF498-domain-containing protein n=1 Tax=Auriscalpium vulgare TaxID=40419 RepID=A0ACB8SC02_9AGAM|nr:DUF498-domain-containing protein [Auriscalpium vulgare]